MKQFNQFASLAILSILLAGCGGSSGSDQKELPAEIVDRIDLVDLDGNEIDLAQFRGKTIFLNYWATWCRPCIAEMPDINEASKILKEEYVFLAASDESLKKIKKYANNVDYSFQIVKSKTSVFDLEIKALPTTMIISKEGKIIFNEVGSRKWDNPDEIEHLRTLATQ